MTQPVKQTSKRDIAARRREAVSRLRAQGLTMREIAEKLPLLDPPVLAANGKPFTYATVYNDLNELRKQWAHNATMNLSEHLSAQLASLNEVERQAWERNDLDAVLKAVGLKMKLMGTDAPAKVEDWKVGDWREYALKNGLNEEDVVAEAQRIIATRGRGSDVAQTKRDRPQASGS